MSDFSSGERLGPYELMAPIGAGGMGVVWRARDVRLDRFVAIKILPDAFSRDPEWRRRFEREARAVAAVSHPNILALHDVGEQNGTYFAVMELLEGETLRERLDAGPVPMRKAVDFGIQIANGLAAAHDQGIVHRDLKPENLFVTKDGRVKILDFGIARTASPAGRGDDANTPTRAVDDTDSGMTMGTVGYMSPEQVRGETVDARSDIFSLGCVMYELLTGRRAFRKGTAAETMAAILNEDVTESSRMDGALPAELQRIVRRCLEKNRHERFQTTRDLAFALSGLSDSSGRSATPGDEARRPRVGSWLGWGIAALVLAMLAPVASRHLREPPSTPQPVRFQIFPTVEFGDAANFSVSPDGRRLAFTGRGSDGIPRLWIRELDSLDVRPVAGSEIPDITPPPFWSPDGRFVALDTGGRVIKLDVTGGVPQPLCDVPSLSVGGSWNRQGDIILGNITGGLLRVRETGGAASPLTAVQAQTEEFHLLPTFLPDGRHFLYLRVIPGMPDRSGVYIGTLDARPETQSTERLMPYAVGITYAAVGESVPGRLLFLRGGTLMAQPFDAERLSIAGDPVAVAERVGSFRDGGFFSASNNGVLIYRTTDTNSQVSWFDRQGAIISRVSEPGAFRDVALSADGARAVVSRTNPQDAATADLWLLDVSGRGGATRLTLGGEIAEFPVWSADNRRIIYTLGKNRLRQKLASGDADDEDVLQSRTVGVIKASHSSPDGRYLLYTAHDLKTTKWDLWVLPRDNPKPVPFVRTAFDEIDGRFSPDGRWVAYVSNQSGVNEVYVREFTTDFAGGSAGVGGSMLVSRGGGTAPRWRGDGRELFYLATSGQMMSVEVKPGPTFHALAPTVLFQSPAGTIVGDAAPDGKRFLLVTPVGPSASAPFTVVLNWTSALKN